MLNGNEAQPVLKYKIGQLLEFQKQYSCSKIFNRINMKQKCYYFKDLPTERIFKINVSK